MSKQLESILGRATRATPPSTRAPVEVPVPVDAPVEAATPSPVDPAGPARALQKQVATGLDPAKEVPAPAGAKPQPSAKRTTAKARPSTRSASEPTRGRAQEKAARTLRANGSTPKGAGDGKDGAGPQRPIQAIVPVSVARALAVRAAMEDTTVRDLILRGLSAIGIDVPEDECRDRRR